MTILCLVSLVPHDRYLILNVKLIPYLLHGHTFFFKLYHSTIKIILKNIILLTGYNFAEFLGKMVFQNI